MKLSRVLKKAIKSSHNEFIENREKSFAIIKLISPSREYKKMQNEINITISDKIGISDEIKKLKEFKKMEIERIQKTIKDVSQR